MPNRLRFLAAAMLSALTAAAAAQTTSDRVLITGQRVVADAPRHDVHIVCPAIADQLPEALATAWHRVGQEGLVRVQFTLDGQAVRDVNMVSGPKRYARWVRSAMHEVNCRADTRETQTFQFNIRFVDPQDRPTQQAVAVLMH